MKKLTLFSLLLAAVIIAGCDNKPSKEQIAKNNALIESAHKNRNYNQILQLADSLERTDVLAPSKAYYWLGYASDRLKRMRMAEFYWKSSLEAAANSTSDESVDIYAKSASRLTNLLSVRGDFENALKIAIPAAERLERLECDTTSDYVNLLIYIGCCQAGLGYSGESTEDGFKRAYNKHLENIEKNHTDEAYKNAIAGLINIAYACNFTKNYGAALNWISRFGELLGEYEQRPSTDGDYIDKQVARFDIYKAIALQGLGRKDEAAKVYEMYLETDYSKTPEGHINANDYLVAANRWEEAADNYRSLDTMLGSNKGSYSMDDIRNLMLKKYKANLLAGRRDSAIAVSLQISNALDKAFDQAKRIDDEEQATIVQKVEQMTNQRAKDERMKAWGLLGVLGFLIVAFIAYFIYRSHATQRMKVAYHELEEQCELLEKRTAEKAQADTEHRITRSVQQRMMPQDLPHYPGLGLSVMLISSDGVCGDLYDCIIRDDKLIFCIGNPAEKDVESSMLTGMVWSLFRNIAYHEDTPDQIVTFINKALTNNSDSQMGISLFVGILDLQTGEMEYCNAGYLTPLLLDQEVNPLPLEEKPDLPVGMKSSWKYMSQEMTLDKGVTLFLYTSGLPKAKNSHSRQYGNKMVRGAALQAMKLNQKPDMFLDGMRDAIEKYTDNTPQDSDMTMLVIRRS
jgi:serine phosphatase RsbU (regulator of sigma subunit)